MTDLAQWPEISIESGCLRGEVREGVVRFLGVPYAAAPMGERRFAVPMPHPSWQGIRNAIERGPNAPQGRRPFPRINMTPLIGSGWRSGDDYLTANVWVPHLGAATDTKPTAGTGGLPVAVFIHGGAWVAGDKDAVVHDGSRFARSGVVCFAINYRLGVEGFVPIPGAPTNLGLRDQIAALQWVRRNAACFGGDPDNVTVFGESAGAMCIANLIASPLARGLFRRAIVQSGHGSMVRSPAVALRLVRALAEHLGISATVADFRRCPVEQCLAALDAVSQPGLLDLRDESGRDASYGLTRCLPVYGDDVLPELPLVALAQGVGAEVDLMIGTNREEMNIYLVPTGLAASMDAATALAALTKVEPHAQAVLEAYRGRRPGASSGAIYTEALTDLVFRLPSRAFAKAHRGNTHCYEFAWRSPALGGALGACHALELPFVFDTLASCTGADGIAGEAPPQGLADVMHNLWVDFMSGRQLPWPAFEDESPIVHRIAAPI